MRKALFILALVTPALTLPLTAHADTIADFKLVGEGHTITFSLPDTALLVDHPHGVTLNATVPTTIVDGVADYNEFDQFYVPRLSDLPSVIIGVPASIDDGILVLFGPWPLQVTEIIPAINPPADFDDDLLVAFVAGTYNLTLEEALPTFRMANYTLTVTTESAATPEPTSLILLATGSFSLLGAIRIRHNRRASAPPV